MKSLEEYKKLNYKAVVQYDPEEDSYFVEFPELPGCMADAATAAEAIEKALKAKDEWLEIAFEAGYKIPEPAVKLETTGRQTVRMPKSLHARLLDKAEQEGVSQNQLILSFIAEGLTRTTIQKDLDKELEELRILRAGLAQLLTEASDSQWLSAPTLNEITYGLPLTVQRSINANAVRNSMVANAWPGATYATADMIPACQESATEKRPPHTGIIAATEEGYQGGYPA